jgi:hypothetical protein
LERERGSTDDYDFILQQGLSLDFRAANSVGDEA